ncbi:hypothetical protein [Falsiroseomonas oryzae]|uniref:hypothetical protein n=1 Tax=Falsiroseomonas oryzae TaxID=2766473 RepID=UPI0022EB43AF|nr:hypothetical protein [Roseomonas sp. MO-31]
MGWLLIGAGLVVLVLAVRIGGRRARGVTQGVAALVAAAGALHLLRRPGTTQLPGYGPRQWRQP